MKPFLSVLLFFTLLQILFPVQTTRATGYFNKAEIYARTVGSDGPALREATASKKIKPSVLSKLPLDFIENLGQWHAGVRFVARKGMSVVRFESDAIKFDSGYGNYSDLTLSFECADRRVKITGEGKRSGYYNFFIGNDPKKWRSRARVFTSLLYLDLYSGVDMRVREEGGSHSVFKVSLNLYPTPQTVRTYLGFLGFSSIFVLSLLTCGSILRLYPS